MADEQRSNICPRCGAGLDDSRDPDHGGKGERHTSFDGKAAEEQVRRDNSANVESKWADESLKILMEAVETLPIGITIVNTEGNLIYLNPAEAEMHGYRVADLAGRNARILAPPESWNSMPFEKLRAMGVWKRESTNIKADGARFPVQLTSKAVRNGEGVPIGIITACEDITERMKMEEKLIQRQEALRRVYSIATTLGNSFKTVCDDVAISLSKLLHASHIVVLRRLDGNVKMVSGIANGSLIEDDMTCPEQCSCCEALTAKKTITLKGSLRAVCPHFPFAADDFNNLASVPVVNDAGDAVAAISILGRAVVDFDEDAHNLVKIFARYIASVIDRDVMEEKLRDAQKMEVIGKLAGGVAHEVRNPLHAIMALCDALGKDIGHDPEYQPFLDHIHVQVDRLATLMTDLLDLGKPVDKSNLRKELLSEMCSTSLAVWKQSAHARTHEVRIHLLPERDETAVRVDGRKLQQVIMNLLDNAAQHSPGGDEIQMIIDKPGDSVCRVRVIDHGTGIPQESLPRIFEPFFSTRKGGTGLGMGIVKHIVEAHQGAVTIGNNDPPPGCTVEIRLPLAGEDNP